MYNTIRVSKRNMEGGNFGLRGYKFNWLVAYTIKTARIDRAVAITMAHSQSNKKPANKIRIGKAATPSSCRDAPSNKLNAIAIHKIEKRPREMIWSGTFLKKSNPQKLEIEITAANGKVTKVPVNSRIQTADEIEYYRNGGILHYVLRQLAVA